MVRKPDSDEGCPCYSAKAGPFNEIVRLAYNAKRANQTKRAPASCPSGNTMNSAASGSEMLLHRRKDMSQPHQRVHLIVNSTPRCLLCTVFVMNYNSQHMVIPGIHRIMELFLQTNTLLGFIKLSDGGIMPLGVLWEFTSRVQQSL